MTSQQTFDQRNKIKQQTHKNKSKIFFKERDIFYIKMWKNIRFEQNWKWIQFSRPVIIIKKFNNEVFRWVALSTKDKSWKYYFSFNLKNIKQYAILSQLRLYDKNRILKKIWMINQEDFNLLKQKIRNLL